MFVRMVWEVSESCERQRLQTSAGRPEKTEGGGVSKRQTAESQCNKCYARILWATNRSSGGRMPLNLKPEKITAVSVGPFYLLDDFEVICSRATADVVEKAIQNERALFTNHMVTCEKRVTQQFLPIQDGATNAN
jgi:hypothetical protein